MPDNFPPAGINYTHAAVKSAFVKGVDLLMPHHDFGFASLDQSQLDSVKQAEAQLNSSSGNTGSEIILLAYTKPNKA